MSTYPSIPIFKPQYPIQMSTNLTLATHKPYQKMINHNTLIKTIIFLPETAISKSQYSPAICATPLSRKTPTTSLKSAAPCPLPTTNTKTKSHHSPTPKSANSTLSNNPASPTNPVKWQTK
jgi:hypothetical protein